jgi:hypothetical protein
MTEPIEAQCVECGGQTIEFRFAGKDTQYRLCPRWREPGHLSESELRTELQAERLAASPSGRQA